MRLIHWIAAGLLMPTVVNAAPTIPSAPPSVAPPIQVIDWVRDRVVRAEIGDGTPDASESKFIDGLVRGARIIGLGENGHGSHEPLAYRNRLVRYLVVHRGLTAVALESGLAESRQLYDYVLGADGDVSELLRTGLTHGFGNLRENLQLIEWLRTYNAAHPRRPVHIYGIDASTIQSAGPGETNDHIVIDHLVAYLMRTVPEVSTATRAKLQALQSNFDERSYKLYSDEQRTTLVETLKDANALFRSYKTEMIQSSSREEYNWRAREAYDAADLQPIFATWTDDPFNYEALIHLLELRDLAMADNVGWVLQREGPKGKVLLFQANGHIAGAPLIGSVMRSFPRQPKLTGMLLRERLGRAYRTIATVSSRGRSAGDASLGSVDRAFAAAGRSPVLLDLGPAPRPKWWEQLQSASQGDARVDDLFPADDFDGLLYFDHLTPVAPLRPQHD